MDIAAARAAMPGILRDALGELVSILPMVEGRVSGGPDPSREILVAVPARYDVIPETDEFGGSRAKAGAASGDSDTPSVSIERVRMLWLPRQGDHVHRLNMHSGLTEKFRISRVAELLPGIVLLYLQRI